MAVQDDPARCPDIYRLFNDLCPIREHYDDIYLWYSCADFLLHHEYQVQDVLADLTQVESEWLQHVIWLVIRYAPSPDPASDLLLHKLLCGESDEKRIAAATLAILDCPWSRKLLRKALLSFEEPYCSWEVLAALRVSSDRATREAADHWEANNLMAGFDPEYWLSEYMRVLNDRIWQLREKVLAWS
jgi:hypothetical protein